LLAYMFWFVFLLVWCRCMWPEQWGLWLLFFLSFLWSAFMSEKKKWEKIVVCGWFGAINLWFGWCVTPLLWLYIIINEIKILIICLSITCSELFLNPILKEKASCIQIILFYFFIGFDLLEILSFNFHLPKMY